jgi:nucleotide-binding universal stress UspA family protein
MVTLQTSRIKVNKVLFATDFTPASDAAFQCAASVARAFDATLNIVNVVQPVVYPSDMAAGLPDTLTIAQSLAREKMAALEASSTLRALPHEAIVRDGMVTSTVRAMVEEEGIDLVIVGTHGAHGLEKAILGSTAEEIFRTVTCPVITVGPNVRENYGGKFNSIIFATDLSIESLRAAQYAVSWALETQAHLTLLHVVKDRDDSNTEHVLERQRAALIELRSLIPDEAMFWCEPRCEVAFGDPEREILDAAERYKANLIVMGVRRAPAMASHTLWATASRVVQKAKCPVLTIRDHFAE